VTLAYFSYLDLLDFFFPLASVFSLLSLPLPRSLFFLVYFYTLGMVREAVRAPKLTCGAPKYDR
jgi:hypothetical protein